ncbi:hypothetical protein AXF42_Ash020773 [Apostasia shenzhenica]|uniref:Uncharacterized protein n=1 Tax=Apostasia shenzhenica TaxID=1088818 RepID=A0A2I0A4K1_9ASPA|nr:hypothetical protein AXF42_Ash020773 [Apostasia shenzhenica]
MEQERKAKENKLRLLESERQCCLAEKHLLSVMRGLEESNCREAELQRLLEDALDQSREEPHQEFKAPIKEALERSLNMLGLALLDRGLVSREDLEGLNMNECIFSRSRSYQCPFFKMSAERMKRMFAFISNLKVVIPPTEAEMARAEGITEGVPLPSVQGEETSEGPLAVSPLRSQDSLEGVPQTPGADIEEDSGSEISGRGRYLESFFFVM